MKEIKFEYCHADLHQVIYELLYRVHELENTVKILNHLALDRMENNG